MVIKPQASCSLIYPVQTSRMTFHEYDLMLFLLRLGLGTVGTPRVVCRVPPVLFFVLTSFRPHRAGTRSGDQDGIHPLADLDARPGGDFNRRPGWVTWGDCFTHRRCLTWGDME